MSVKDQIGKLKENWLMVVLGLVVLMFISGGNGIIGQSFDGIGGFADRSYNSKGGIHESEMMIASDSSYYGNNNGDFAPEVEERKITRSSNLNTEIERGEFSDAEEKLKNIVTSSGAYMLSESVNRNGEGWKGYYNGYYNIKVDTSKYDSVLSQLKEIGEVQSFSQDADDVTARYDNLEIEIASEKSRLARYLEMYDEAEEVEYKIDLSDRISNQERKIKYLEDSLKNVDNRIEYSSIGFSMNEERSDWLNISLVKISDLVRTFVDNLNALLGFIFGIIPWAVVAWLGWFFWKRFKK
jgi:hypothetical protein